MSLRIKVAPKVSLHMVKHDAIMKDIDDGVYDKHPSFLSSHKPTSKTNTKKSILEEMTNTLHDGTKDTIVHTNTAGTKIYTVTTSTCAYKNIMGGTCYYCRRKFKTDPLGYCVGISFYQTDPVYLLEDRMICSGKCVMAYIDYIVLPAKTEDKIRRNTHQMLTDIYGCVPSPANDFRLLDINGGSLALNEWDKDVYRCVHSPAIASVKREFMKVTK